jgi:thioesterase domain-containing protein
VLYEMARQLQAEGVVPGIVLMFDVVVPGSAELLGSGVKVAKFWQNVRQGRLGYLRRKAKEKREYFRLRLLEGAVFPAAVFCYKLVGLPLPAALRFYHISQGHWRAMSRYTIKPFPGKITLVKAIDRGPEVLGQREDPTLGWGTLALGGLDIVEVPTKHMFMLFEPYVASFAEKLKTILPS